MRFESVPIIIIMLWLLLLEFEHLKNTFNIPFQVSTFSKNHLRSKCFVLLSLRDLLHFWECGINSYLLIDRLMHLLDEISNKKMDETTVHFL